MSHSTDPPYRLQTETPRVLVVDDEPDFLELVEDLLVDQTVALTLAEDPEDALEKLAQGPIDVMLVDLQMPKGGGRRLLTDARRLYPSVYSIVVTAYGSESIAVEMLRELGAHDYLAKTDISEASLAERISRAYRASFAGRVASHRGFEILGEACAEGVWSLFPVGYLSAQPELRRLPRLARAVDALREQGVRRLVIDLGHLTFAVARAMGFLLVAVQKFEAAGGRAVLCCPEREVVTSLRDLVRQEGDAIGLRVFGARRSALAALEG